MKRLSELHPDTMLTVLHTPYGFRVMTVEDVIGDRYYEDENARFSLAEKEVLAFNLEDILDFICEDGYEDMVDDVKTDVFEASETEPFLRMIKEVFESYPVYYEGETILNDLKEVEE